MHINKLTTPEEDRQFIAMLNARRLEQATLYDPFGYIAEAVRKTKERLKQSQD